MLRLKLEMNPVPWSAPRVTKKAAYSPRRKEMDMAIILIKKELAENDIEDDLPYQKAVEVRMTFHMPVPEACQESLADYKEHTVKPDLCNMVKFFEDALQRAQVIKNDSQIVYSLSKKKYAIKPLVDIEIIEHLI
jgi:Holliday junction resolvase RusA-like endonuclease